MSDQPDEDRGQPLIEVPAPAIRVAPLGEIGVHQITEDELSQLAAGSPGSLSLNLGLTCASAFLSFLATLLTASLSDRAFIVFVVICVASAFAAAILLCFWYRSHESQASLIKRIRSRMPPKPAGREGVAIVMQPRRGDSPPSDNG